MTTWKLELEFYAKKHSGTQASVKSRMLAMLASMPSQPLGGITVAAGQGYINYVITIEYPVAGDSLFAAQQAGRAFVAQLSDGMKKYCGDDIYLGGWHAPGKQIRGCHG